MIRSTLDTLRKGDRIIVDSSAWSDNAPGVAWEYGVVSTVGTVVGFHFADAHGNTTGGGNVAPMVAVDRAPSMASIFSAHCRYMFDVAAKLHAAHPYGGIGQQDIADAYADVPVPSIMGPRYAKTDPTDAERAAVIALYGGLISR